MTKRYTQKVLKKKGIDYFDKYFPIASITTIWALAGIASIYKLTVHQIEIKTAFLNGESYEKFTSNNLRDL